jgi:hypothetical protein
MKRPTTPKVVKAIPPQLRQHAFQKGDHRAVQMGTRGGKVTRVSHSKASRQ